MKELVEAIEGAVARLRAENPDIPEVVLVVGGTGHGTIHGYFQPNSWAKRVEDTQDAPEQDGFKHEVLLAGESLRRGGRATFGTLVHELTHAYCHANGIRDTSNTGRYHNKKFKEQAERFGLHIEKADTIGWSVTTVTDELASRYATEIDRIDAAIQMYRRVGFKAAEAKKATKWVMVCEDCNDPVPIGKRWFERNRPQCAIHNLEYTLEAEEDA